jgi:fatty-acyl-CoA synthase
VATLGPTTPDLVVSTMAIWHAGAVAVPLPLPMRLASIEAFIDQTRRRIEAADCSFLLVDPLFESQVPPIPGVQVIPLGSLQSDREHSVSGADEDIALIQYTSGSTNEPRGVTLTHANLLASTHSMAEGAAFVPETDVVFSWLPLYHDMGLIGTLLTPAVNGATLWLLSPQAFLARPRLWLEAMAETGTTITCAPNFAYALAARALRHGGLDLSSLRLALNGAEPIDTDTVREFVAAGAECGIRPSVPFPVYGLAEATLGVAFPSLDDTWIVDEISRDAAEQKRLAESCLGGKEVVSEGYPIRGMEIRIARTSTDRVIDEIQIRGPAVTPGYYKRPDLHAQLFTHDGWLRTGDLGYMVDGRLHVTGRAKDLIIVGGRNIYPQDVEASVQEVDGVRKGNCVAYAIDGRGGREAICVVAETRDADPTALSRAVIRRVSDDHGVAPQRVVLLPPGTLPKTSSGKLQRSLTRDMLDRGELETLGEPVSV